MTTPGPSRSPLTYLSRRADIVRMAVRPHRGPFTVADFHRLAQVGVLHEDDRVELVDGQVVEMSPIGEPHAACVRRRVPVNVVDVPELCTFTVPATLRRGALTIAISTNGSAPALAKAIRRELERLYPARFASIVARLGKERSRRPRGRARQRLMIRLVDGVMSAR